MRRVPVLALAAVALHGATAAAAQEKTVPMVVANSSGKPVALYLHAVGHMGGSDVPGYLTATGTFKTFPAAAGATPKDTVTVALRGPADGKRATFVIPRGFSGRVYYSFSRQIRFKTVKRGDGSTGLVQPVPWKAGAENHAAALYDWVEITYDDGGLWWNTTQVDQFAIPARLAIADASGTRSTGAFTTTVAELGAKLRKVPGFERVVQRSGGALRLVNPSHLFEARRFSATYLDAYVARVWRKYEKEDLVMRPFLNAPAKRFTGRVKDGRLVFTDGAAAVVSTFDRPSTRDVFECSGALASPNDETTGPISRSLCADLNRGVLGTQALSPSTRVSTYYRTNAMNGGRYNHFSAAMHSAFEGGKAYGFSFDDVNGQDTLVNSGSPRRITFAVLAGA